MLPGLSAGDLAPVQSLTAAVGRARPRRPARLARFLQTHRSQARRLRRLRHRHSRRNQPCSPTASCRDCCAGLALRADGADLIDVGCDPGDAWAGVGDAVEALRDAGLARVHRQLQSGGGRGGGRGRRGIGTERQRQQRRGGPIWGCEVVALPDVLATLEGLDATIEKLTAWGVPFRIDPVIEPIGFGFAASLGRYLEVRRRYPDAEMMMGVGNLTELTDVDSAGVNVLLLGFCQEVGIRSVLTTQVINWCRSCVRELDLARRLVYHACTRRVLPKHLEPDLVLLRDPEVAQHGDDDAGGPGFAHNRSQFRLFAERGRLHVLNNKMHLQGTDPFALFDEMQRREPIDPSHAFYLGYEMAKAVTALTLGKNYMQDQALRWGFLTVPEESHRLK